MNRITFGSNLKVKIKIKSYILLDSYTDAAVIVVWRRAETRLKNTTSRFVMKNIRRKVMYVHIKNISARILIKENKSFQTRQLKSPT